ncbi:MAG: MFS transporter [Chitinophagaceae bacterium]|nr:MFS transporter [Chitinophagaceae bacterium]
MTGKERIIVFLLAALNFTHILDFIVMVPLSIYLMPYFNISAFQFSMLVAAYSISAFFSGLIVALLVDRFDRKRSLILGYVGFLLGTIACGLANSYGLLLAARIFAGLFGGILGAQVFSIIADLFEYKRRGRAMGAVMSAFAVATVIGVPLSLYLTNLFNFNWHIPFLIIGSLGIILIPLMIRFIPKMTGHVGLMQNTSRYDALVKTITIPIQRSALVFSCLFMFGHFLVIPFIPSYLEFNKGFTKEQIPLILLTGGTASFISAIFLGRFSDKKGKLPVFIWSVLFSLVLILILTNMPDMHLAIVLLFFAILFMTVTGRIVMAQAMISEIVAQEQRGSFMSVNGSVQQLGQGLASLAAGFIVYTDRATHKIFQYDKVGYLSILVLIISMFIGRSVFRAIDVTEKEFEPAQLVPETEVT